MEDLKFLMTLVLFFCLIMTFVQPAKAVWVQLSFMNCLAMLTLNVIIGDLFLTFIWLIPSYLWYKNVQVIERRKKAEQEAEDDFIE